MYIKVESVEADNESIIPSLKVGLEIQFYEYLEVPISITGSVYSGNSKLIGTFHEEHIHHQKDIPFRLMSNSERDKRYSSGSNGIGTYYPKCNVLLSSPALEHLETVREKHNAKSCILNFRFLVKTIMQGDNFDGGTFNSNHNFLSLKLSSTSAQFEIKESDWVRSYTPILGIGTFLLLEYRIPELSITESPFWFKWHSALISNVEDMENCIRWGDWQGCMTTARKFYENAKIGDKKPANTKMKSEFSKSMMDAQHSDEGIGNLLDGIWQFFEYFSKFIHEKNKQGEFQPTPIASKEDAYFAYSTAVGLLNLITEKIREKPRSR